MKKRTKSIIGLSLATLACGAVAAVLPVASASAETPETGVFKIADGASIRYQSLEGRPEGLRFIALMSEDVKEALVGKNFGFIVSREDQFDKLEAATEEGATPDYLSMANKSTAEVAITAENIDEKIYEGEDEYAGYWCANIVINMNTQEGTSETVESFMERTYSAVAYYENADETNRVYTTNRQERSIQEVSSKLYLSNDEDWENVKGVYTVGTESTPLLLAQNGKNAYSKLVSMVKAETVDSTLKFAFAENVVAEELLPDTFTNIVATDKAAYDVESFYTVNHAVTDVYSTNKAISLTDKVSAVSGKVSYKVYDSKGVAVPVADNAFTANTAGAYTVTAALENCPGKTFSVEVADNEYADGLILDGTSAEELQVTSSSKNTETGVWEDSTTVEMLTSFDESMKYDSESNGSYKVKYKMQEGVSTAEGGALMKLAMKPTFSKAYYEGLKAAGYTNIAVRAFIEMDSATSDGSGLYYINTTQAESERREMKIYSDNSTLVNKPSSYIFWKYEFATSLNKWVEIVLDINKFTDEYASGYMNLLIWQVGPNASVDMTVYIDNIYAVNGAIGGTLTAPKTVYADKGTQFDVQSVAGATDNVITTATLDGKAINVTDGKVTLDTYGVYSVKKLVRNYYGYVAENVIPNGTVVANIADNFSATHKINSTGATTIYNGAVTANGIEVSSDGAGKISGISVTTYAIKALGDADYYTALSEAGYQYITYEYTLSYTGTASGAIYRYGLVTTDAKHTNDFADETKANTNAYNYTVTDANGANKYDTSTKGAASQGFQSTWSPASWNGKTFIISIPIDKFIANYNADKMRILAFYFNGAAATMDYSVTFGRIQATKEACKF